MRYIYIYLKVCYFFFLFVCIYIFLPRDQSFLRSPMKPYCFTRTHTYIYVRVLTANNVAKNIVTRKTLSGTLTTICRLTHTHTLTQIYMYVYSRQKGGFTRAINEGVPADNDVRARIAYWHVFEKYVVESFAGGRVHDKEESGQTQWRFAKRMGKFSTIIFR